MEQQYGKICSVEEIGAIFDSSINQTNREETWIPLVNNVTIMKKGEEDQLLYDATERKRKDRSKSYLKSKAMALRLIKLIRKKKNER